VTGELAWLWWVAAAALIVLALILVWIWRKGRPIAAAHVFRASRLSDGNRLFPTQVRITSTSVIHYTPEWFGHEEKSIHMAHVSSVKVDTNLLFSDVVIETSGGSHPIVCHGHKKRDAVEMKALIERYQTEYYRTNAASTRTEPSAPR
jgi:hypothetical protein